MHTTGSAGEGREEEATQTTVWHTLVPVLLHYVNAESTLDEITPHAPHSLNSAFGEHLNSDLLNINTSSKRLMIFDFSTLFPPGTVEYIDVIWPKDRVAAKIRLSGREGVGAPLSSCFTPGLLKWHNPTPEATSHLMMLPVKKDMIEILEFIHRYRQQTHKKRQQYAASIQNNANV